MVKQIAIVLFSLVIALGSGIGAHAQASVTNLCPYKGHPTSLSCLIPDVTLTGNSQNLGSFNTTIAQVLGQLPLAAPVSGFVLAFDKSTGQFVPLNENLGSVLTERGNTVGKNKIFVGFTAQRFVFHSIDGISLNSVPTVFQLGGNASGVYGANTNHLSANLNQYTTIIAYGISDRIDASVTIPYQRISLSGGYNNYYNAFLSSSTVNPGSPPSNFVAGSAHGFGDILLNLKGTAYNGEKIKVALGFESRLPTGDEFNFLGSGALGLKPYVVLSRLGRYAPHVNLGYQWNDYSSLYINPKASSCGGTCNGTLQLPRSLDYSAGIDVGVIKKKLTLVGDFVGQHYFSSPGLTSPVPAGGHVPGLPASGGGSSGTCHPTTLTEFTACPTVLVSTGGVNVDNLSVGLKYRPAWHLIISANALIRLDDGGLRPDRFVPLVGISYLFGR